jgi:hypothetical protein
MNTYQSLHYRMNTRHTARMGHDARRMLMYILVGVSIIYPVPIT